MSVSVCTRRWTIGSSKTHGAACGARRVSFAWLAAKICAALPRTLLIRLWPRVASEGHVKRRDKERASGEGEENLPAGPILSDWGIEEVERCAPPK